MKILIIGTGGREHALAWKCAQDPQVSTVYVAAGNAGTANEPKCKNVSLAVSDHQQVINFCKEKQVSLVVVGPEAPLVDGLVDSCRAADIATWGPSAYCAQLEGSKNFAKEFMAENSIPTAAYQTFTEIKAAKDYVLAQGAPIVVKADGLAAGKGVIVAEAVAQAHAAIEDMLAGNKFGEAGSRVVIEQFLQGEEASFICMVDGENILPMASSQDHKRIGEGDTGLNTGGMGAYSPAPVVTDEVTEKVMQRIIQPVVTAMKASGNPYTGFLYAGLMIDEQNDPYVIEFNCRFGDPETQPVMMRLKSSLVSLIEQGIKGKLPAQAEWDKRKSIGIVLASDGYPESSSKGDDIHGLPPETATSKVFHAGTKLVNDSIQTNGGRVLCVTTLADSISEAQANALALCGDIQFSGMQYRRDIGYRAIARENA